MTEILHAENMTGTENYPVATGTVYLEIRDAKRQQMIMVIRS